MAEQGLPQCRCCFRFMPPGFESFPLCPSCWFENQRTQVRRLHAAPPSYRTATQALARQEYDGNPRD